MNEYTFLICPVRNRPIAGSLRMVRGALSVKCRFCGEVHLISRNDLDSQWDALDQQKISLPMDDESTRICSTSGFMV